MTRVGLPGLQHLTGRFGSGRIGSGRVGSGGVQNLTRRVGVLLGDPTQPEPRVFPDP